MAYSVPDVTRYIREAAIRRGIDPNVALRVARSEGLASGVWQSNVVRNGRRETSYGPFQLLEGGGLGDKFARQYGRSPSDPSTVYQQVDFALDEAKKGGWGPWYGAAKVGVGNRTGLGGQEGSAPMGFDWSKYAVQGAARPDSFSGMQPDFQSALSAMFQNAPPEIQAQLRVGSGFRSQQRQAELWAGALKKYGSPEAARKWVAPPGQSQHGHGNAADLKYLSPEAKQWAHANAAKFGLAFPLSNEDWHVELASARPRGMRRVGGAGSGASNFAPMFGSMNGAGGNMASGDSGGGIDPIAAQLAAGEKEKKRNTWGDFGAAIDASIPRAPGISGGGGAFGNAGNVLATIMQNPQALAQALLKRRMV